MGVCGGIVRRGAAGGAAVGVSSSQSRKELQAAQNTASSSLLTPQLVHSFTFRFPDDFLRCALMGLCVIIHYAKVRLRRRFCSGGAWGTVREATVSESICPDCGERNARGTEFCSACGAFLAWDGQDVDPEPAPARPAQVAPAVTPPVSPRGAPAPPNPAVPTPSNPRTDVPPNQDTSGRPVSGQSWRPTQPVVTAGEQIVRQPVAQAWNAAAPALGAQLPGGLSVGSIAQEAGLAGGGWQGAGWGGGSGQGQPPPGGPPQGPPAYVAPPEPPPPTEGPCPRCGVVNGASLRFCSKCGFALRGPTLHDGGGARPQPPPERVPWWRRWFRPGGDNTRRAARAAYRHSLPLRIRLIRWGLALFGVGAIVGTLAYIGQNPVGWAINNWNDIVGNTTQVQGVEAFTQPQPGTETSTESASPSASPPTSGSAALPAPDTAQNVVDNLSDTAWTTPWKAEFNQVPTEVSCDTPVPVGSQSILLVPSGSVTLKKISVVAGLTEGDSRRMLQWRPKTIQLSYSNGQCQQIVLDDVADLQERDLETVETSQVLLSIIDVYEPATDQPENSLSVTELRLFERG